MGIVSKIVEFDISRFTWPPIRAGWRNSEGYRLREKPELSEIPRVKFAVFGDSRLFDRFWVTWKKFRKFLPNEFDFIGGPLNMNSFEDCILAADINNQDDPKYEEAGSEDFEEKLALRGYSRKNDLKPQLGDIIAYYCVEKPEVYIHAGKFQADGRIRSRWSSVDKQVVGPVVDHPVLEILPVYRLSHLGALDIPEKINQDKIRFDVFRGEIEDLSRIIAEEAVYEIPKSGVQCYGVEEGMVAGEDCNHDCGSCKVDEVIRGSIELPYGSQFVV